jgi:hypothetical protein
MKGSVTRPLWRFLGMAVTVLLIPTASAVAGNDDGNGTPVTTLSRTPETTLYEITESVRFTGTGVTTSRDAVAVLMGTASVGTPLCPADFPMPPGLAPLVHPVTHRCTITAIGKNVVPLATGIGPVSGTFAVVVNAPGNSSAHIPDLPILTGTFEGTNDLSLAVLRGVPIGFIQGSFRVDQTGQVLPFSGTFRLPFAVTASGQDLKEAEEDDQQHFYLDDKGRLIEVGDRERVLGLSPVRLEIRFQ